MQLEHRKLDVYEAIRTLDRDHREGIIDAASYRASRARYELEAAHILERLDRLPDDLTVAPARAGHTKRRRFAIFAAGGLTVLAVSLFLATALRARTGNAAITGDVGQATPPAVSGRAPQVLAAMSRVKAQPWNPDMELQLATAYLNAKDNRGANSAYLRALQLAPHRADVRTMYAMFKGSGGDSKTALHQLTVVEREHPGYPRAWLVDGLLSSRLTAGLPRAIHAWRRFLVVSPHATVAPQVRALLTSAENAQAKP